MITTALLLGLLAAGDSLVYRGDSRELEVEPPRVENPRIDVDGSLDEPEWARAAVLTGFTQYEPVESLPATQRTEIRVFYSEDAIYFGIHAFDTHPELVRATLPERDRAAFDDDWVRVMLDTRNDHRQAYVFYVNPLGVQQDGLWLEGGTRRESGVPIDFNPDFIWDSYGRVTADGWVAEIRIPYISLRFPATPVQTWGINIAREVKRNGFKESWAPITRDQSSTLAQGGRLTGLRDLRNRKLVEVNPVVTGKRTAERSGDGEWAREDFAPEAGANLRYGVTSNLMLGATINPDFSQLESDAGQIAVNERFALFFPEKRPFFLEGTEIFQTPQQLVYTRAIVEPLGGVKLSGELGGMNVGYLSALDEAPLSATAAGEKALFNLVRLRREIGGGSTAGALITDRTLTESGDYNRVFSADTRLLFGGRYALTAQGAASWSRSGTAGGAAAAPMLFARLERSGRNFNWEARFEDIDPDFRARSGFIRRVGDANMFASAEYTFFGKPGALVERWGPELRVENFWDHDRLWRGGSPFEGEVELQLNLLLRGKNRLNAILRDGYFDFQPADYGRYQVGDSVPLAPFADAPTLRHMLALALIPNLQPLPWLAVGGRIYFREVPIYAEANRGVELLLSPNVRATPTPRLNFELSHAYSQLWRVRDESLFSTVQISRAKVKYQFTRALYARAIAEYNLQDRDVLRSPLTGQTIFVNGTRDTGLEAGQLGVNLLGAFEPSPGKVIFLGYVRQAEGPNTYRFDSLEPQAHGLFLKASYIYRF